MSLTWLDMLQGGAGVVGPVGHVHVQPSSLEKRKIVSKSAKQMRRWRLSDVNPPMHILLPFGWIFWNSEHVNKNALQRSLSFSTKRFFVSMLNWVKSSHNATDKELLSLKMRQMKVSHFDSHPVVFQLCPTILLSAASSPGQSWALSVFLNIFNNKKWFFLHFLSS